MASSNKLPRFYTVFLSQYSSNALLIPSSYYEHLPLRLPKTAILNGTSGRSWKVTMVSRGQQVYFEQGWASFVADHELKDGEFLTFVFDGHKTYEVSIFSHNSCKVFRAEVEVEEISEDDTESDNTFDTPPITLSDDTQSDIVSSMVVGVIDSATSTEKEKSHTGDSGVLVPEFTITVTTAYLQSLVIPRKFVKKYMPKETMTFKIHLLNETKSWEVMYFVSDKFPDKRLSGGWKRLVKDLGLVVGDVCNFKLIKPTEMLLKVSKESHTGDSAVLIPKFTSTITRAYPNYLTVPRKFVKKYMPKETMTFKIHLLNETKSWEVMYLVSDKHQAKRFSLGWRRLAKDLGLVAGDVCNFELIKPTEMLLKVSKKTT